MILNRCKLRCWVGLCVTLCCAGRIPAQEAAASKRELPQVSLGLPQVGTAAAVPSARGEAPPRTSSTTPADWALPPEWLEAAAPAWRHLPPPPGSNTTDANPLSANPRVVVPLPPPPASPFEFNPLDALPADVLGPGSALPNSVPATPTQPAPTVSVPEKSPLPESLESPSSPVRTSPENRFSPRADAAAAQSSGPAFYAAAAAERPPEVDPQAWRAPYDPSVFSPPPPSSAIALDPHAELSPYRGKTSVAVQRPWVELWRPLYTGGIYPPAKEWFGRHNLVMPHFMVYGDYRTGIGINRNAQGATNNWAQRLNLDMDLELTATERLHAFMGPLDRAGDFTRLDFTDDLDYINRTDLRLDNLFFEGDAGAIWGGLTDQDAPFDLPFSFGLMPLFYQNGVWAADNVLGAAVALPSKNSPLLKWSNYDATFFWASDQINSDAFPGDNNAAEFFGTAWFIEAYDGYIEADYAFVHDDVGEHRSYHNLSVAYTRRYFYRVSNAVRYIANFGQSLPSDQRTADGHMLLIENSLISKTPNTLVPYLNFFYGQGRTQSLARANVAGGVLNNTGINFETDGLTGYPTLDATGVNASGAALGVNILGADFQHQLILELAALSANGQPQLRNAAGDEYAVGMRYQKPLSNAWIFRTDHMLGFREDARDLRGSRVELRWKF